MPDPRETQHLPGTMISPITEESPNSSIPMAKQIRTVCERNAQIPENYLHYAEDQYSDPKSYLNHKFKALYGRGAAVDLGRSQDIEEFIGDFHQKFCRRPPKLIVINAFPYYEPLGLSLQCQIGVEVFRRRRGGAIDKALNSDGTWYANLRTAALDLRTPYREMKNANLVMAWGPLTADYDYDKATKFVHACNERHRLLCMSIEDPLAALERLRVDPEVVDYLFDLAPKEKKAKVPVWKKSNPA